MQKITLDDNDDSLNQKWILGQNALDSGDFGKALHLFEELEKEKEFSAQLKIATIHEIGGNGVNQDYKKARKWYEKAISSTEHPLAYMRLGCIYYGGLGIEVDYEKAYWCFSKLNNRDQPGALFMLGKMYDKGHGVKKDSEQAYYYYHKAMSRGHLLAANELGKLLIKKIKIAEGLQLLLSSMWNIFKIARFDMEDWRITVAWKDDQ